MIRSINARRRAARERHREVAQARALALGPRRPAAIIGIVLGGYDGIFLLGPKDAVRSDVSERRGLLRNGGRTSPTATLPPEFYDLVDAAFYGGG